MYETLTTPLETVSYHTPTVDEAIERIASMERKKERIREGQVRKAKLEKEKKRQREEEEATTAAEAEEGGASKRPKTATVAEEDGRSGEDAVTVSVTVDGTEGDEKGERQDGKTQVHLLDDAVSPMKEAAIVNGGKLAAEQNGYVSAGVDAGEATRPSLPGEPFEQTGTSLQELTSYLHQLGHMLDSTIKRTSMKHSAQARGHTSFLTFATLLPSPKPIPETVTATEDDGIAGNPP
jgi:hypothetical protein